jgi:hypothetical protein
MPQVQQSAVPAPALRRPWTTPRVDDMPRLTALTLQTGPLDPGILGDCDAGNPSSCFG